MSGRISALRQFLAANGSRIQVEQSDEWFKRSFNRAGSWDSWIWETLNGRYYETGEPLFAGFITLRRYLGRANGQIARGALQGGTPVLLWDGDQLHQVVDVLHEDPGDWTAGWTLNTQPLM